MELANRINAFVQLGKKISLLSAEELDSLAASAQRENPWFTPKNVKQALTSIAFMLDENKISQWTSHYEFKAEIPKLVGIIMAGNIPLVGFHDLLCVLLSGNIAIIKPSSQDSFLIKTVISWLIEIEGRYKKNIEIRERLNEIDSVIATGSDNSARYFEYYFGKIPHIIRKNRTSIGIVKGNESKEELEKMGDDVFSYFGLGCRNISKIFVPTNYDLTNLLDAWQPFHYVFEHHKYINNYDYTKSIYLINGEPHLDTGFSILRETDELVSPIGVTFYAYYESMEQLNAKLASFEEKIQCIVSIDPQISSVKPGQAQKPELWDYADGVDTLAFLQKL